MTGEAHRAVVTDPAVNTQVFLWHEGCIYIYIYFFFSFFLSFGCAGSSLLCGLFSSFADLGYSPVAGTCFSLQGLLTVEPRLRGTGSPWRLRGLLAPTRGIFSNQVHQHH